MKIIFSLGLLFAVVGCAVTPRGKIQTIVARVQQCDSLIGLSHGAQGQTMYRSELEVTEPSELAGLAIRITANRELPRNHPLTSVGNLVEFQIADLKNYRSSEYTMEPFRGRIVYEIPLPKLIDLKPKQSN